MFSCCGIRPLVIIGRLCSLCSILVTLPRHILHNSMLSFHIINPSPMPWLSLWNGIALLKERIWPFRQNMSIKLMLSTLGKILKYFSYFSQKTESDISCELSPSETISMKCQILFSWKNKKNIISLPSAELVQRVVKVNLQFWKVSDTREATPCL